MLQHIISGIAPTYPAKCPCGAAETTSKPQHDATHAMKRIHSHRWHRGSPRRQNKISIPYTMSIFISNQETSSSGVLIVCSSGSGYAIVWVPNVPQILYIYSPCRTTSKAWFKVSKPTVSTYIKHSNSIRDALKMFETWSFDHMTCHAEPPWKRPKFPRQASNFWFGTAAAATTGLHTIATWHMEHRWRRSQCIGHVGLIFA